MKESELTVPVTDPNIHLVIKFGTLGEGIKDSVLEFKYKACRSDVKYLLAAIMKELEKRQ